MSCAAMDSGNEAQNYPELVRAPVTIIGSRIEHWVELLGEEFEISKMQGMKNLHTGDPNAILELRNDSTSVTFQVDFIANRHFLLEVQTSSFELIQRLTNQYVELKPNQSNLYQDSFDAGCSTLLLRSGKTKALAKWSYYWD